MVSLHKAALLITIVLTAAVITACGSSSKSGGSTSSGAAGTQSAAGAGQPSTPTSGGCGAIPERMPADPDGVLAKLPKTVQAAYNLFPQAVHGSAWSNWKPKHGPPYTIYFSPGNTFTPEAQIFEATLNQLKANSHLIGRVITQDANNSVQTQIQQFQQAIRDKADVIIEQPLSAAADNPVLQAAGKAGIPVVAPLSVSSNPYIVGVDGNTVLIGGTVGQQLAAILHGKGNILDVHGVPGVPYDNFVFQGVSDALKGCPNIKTIGQVTGTFTPSVAKTATLEFLSANPQPVDAAVQSGGMATGVMQAFMQTGRKVPTVADFGATPGALGYWNSHKSTYNGVALGLPSAQLAAASWNVALGMLEGRGLTITDISGPPLLVTETNLAHWVQPGWSLSTPLAYAPGPNDALDPPSYLNNFFRKPAPK